MNLTLDDCTPVRFHDRTWYVDVHFRGKPHLIACAVLESSSGLILIDPGPASCVDILTKALEPLGGVQRVSDIALTHIHLDHAGACGLLVQRHPHIQVHVHPVGLPHLIRPKRLVRSARRIYGSRLDTLWGPILPIPQANVHAVDHYAQLVVGDRRLIGCHTPGHASHHICWIDDSRDLLLTGDAAGMRVLEAPWIIPVAPPPDIDVELWKDSLYFLESLEPEMLFLTHFGPVHGASNHLSVMYERLHDWSSAVRLSLEEDLTDRNRAAQFHDSEMKLTEASVPRDFLAPYRIMGQPSGSWHGLARYWRKKLST